MSDDDDTGRRHFEPFAKPYYSDIARHLPGALVTYNNEKQFFQLQGSSLAEPRVPRLDKGSLVAYLGVSARPNVEPATYALYFGPGSPYNASGALEALHPDTLYFEALNRSIDLIEEMADKDIHISKVMIATNFRSLVMDVAYADDDDDDDELSENLAKTIARRLDSLEYGDDSGVCYNLWIVEDDENKVANDMAAKV
ncbi:hypothetical protein FQN49_004124 [Arthroderma sp. PD_2]|nr:hypothetical protein FQN49_004124 [Arthroderma sp. PD_2]